MSETAALRAAQISKVYPGTIALKQVDFSVERGGVNVLIGENGAGKSTLMKILAGIETPSSGELFFEDQPLRLTSPLDAARKGIAMVHQELSLMPNLTIAENVFAGREIRQGRFFVDETEQERQAAAILKQLNLDISPKTRVDQLAIGQQQLVEIARALAQKARVLILDEPTSALSGGEIGIFFRVLTDLKQRGVSIVYISHRLAELLEIGEYFTILRDGRVVATAPRKEVSESWIVEKMTGRDLAPTAAAVHQGTGKPAALKVDSLTVTRNGRTCVSDVSFQVGNGEILGVYGLLGAGRTELFETLAGLQGEDSGKILLNGESINELTTAQRLRQGICLVPEDRQHDALIPDMSVRANTSLARIASLCSGGLISHVKEVEETEAMLSRVMLKRCDHSLPITTLSGGNQQKAILARALLTRPALILLDEPTRGVDVGAKAEIYALIRTLAGEGVSVFFSSSDPQEIRDLAQRVLVLCRGVLTADFGVSEATDERLLSAASVEGAACRN